MNLVSVLGKAHFNGIVKVKHLQLYYYILPYQSFNLDENISIPTLMFLLDIIQ